MATPCNHNKTSPSPGDTQNLSSSSLIKQASFTIPPSESVKIMYLQSPILHFDRFLGLMNFIKLNASGPLTSTCLSAAKSPKVTSLIKLLYSFSGLVKPLGKYILL